MTKKHYRFTLRITSNRYWGGKDDYLTEFVNAEGDNYIYRGGAFVNRAVGSVVTFEARKGLKMREYNPKRTVRWLHYP
ncbi:hypothetical protein AB4Z21_26295, partial [Paenibacillus sp. MCAF20]